MKVYVVTTGAYSDYTIEKIFTDKAKAEEYKEWLYDSNDIEEYETEDDFVVVDKFYKITVTYDVHDNHDTTPNVNVYKCTKQDVYQTNICYRDYNRYHSKYFTVVFTRFIPEQNWNEEFYRNKYTKAAYDFAAIAKCKKQEGFSEHDIQMLFRGMNDALEI